uniref:Uncharacterized protein n=1 Tax=Pundamilia nyererei TaxID=303518 RepID=A0A3B4GU19_9CICH
MMGVVVTSYVWYPAAAEGVCVFVFQLQQQLVQKEKELHRREVEEELREKRREAQDWERPAAVLEEVLAAQKDRDQAVMSRLLLANEERDEALLRLHRLHISVNVCIFSL